MQLLPNDSFAMRLVRVCGELTPDRRGHRLFADHVESWLTCAGVSWRDVIDWITERAVAEAVAEARATPEGDRLWLWVSLIIRKVPQWEVLFDWLENVLRTCRIEAGERKGMLDSWSSAQAVAALQTALQRAADNGVCQDDLEELVQFWADANNVTLVLDRTAPGAVTFSVRW